MATVKQILTIAQAELGTMEIPANSNNVKYNTWYYGKAVSGSAYPWCMAFVQWVFNQAGMKLPYLTASCNSLLTWYQKNKPASVVKTPVPGAIIIYNFSHTGIVESVGNGMVTAIEGNTSPGATGSQSNGGMVCRRTRSTSLVIAYIRPEYDMEEKKMDNTPSAAHKEGVEWAQKNGILAGDSSGDLKLSQPLTRQQFCTMLLRFAKWLGKA